MKYSDSNSDTGAFIKGRRGKYLPLGYAPACSWLWCDDCSEESISEEVRQCLRLPSFDCTDWQDEEILLLLQFMFLDFDFPVKFNIDMNTLRNFIFQVYKNYNEVPFHNFRHCFCVSQMVCWTFSVKTLQRKCIIETIKHLYRVGPKTKTRLKPA